MMWRSVVLYPDTKNDWSWSEKPLLRLPAIIHLLITLRRAGVEQVILPPEARDTIETIEHYATKKDLPRILCVGQDTPEYDPSAPTLSIRGGILLDLKLVEWFRNVVKENPNAHACVKGLDGLPLMISHPMKGGDIGRLFGSGFMGIYNGQTLEIPMPPQDLLCRAVEVSSASEDGRALLALIGKPDESIHVKWIRHWTFPVVHLFARTGVSPNQVTWTAFLIGLFGAAVISTGSYWGGVWGGVLLCVSWIGDNFDGTLARLTYSESPLGDKLDSTLGHFNNLFFFSALVYAVYAREPLWKMGFFLFLMTGGIAVAHRICLAERKLRKPAATGKRRFKKLEVFLEQINGRDFAVLILLFALFDGFKFFLWGSLGGVFVFALLHFYLLIKQRSRIQA